MRPRLTTRARLLWNERNGGYVLVTPERGWALNPTATRIIQLCTGDHTEIEVIAHLRREFPECHSGEISNEVMMFLCRIAYRGLIEDADSVRR